MELAVANINSDNLPRSVLQEAVGETTCRRAGIERPHPLHVYLEDFESPVELLGAPADPSRRRVGNNNGVAGGHLPCRIVSECAIDQDSVLRYEFLSLHLISRERTAHKLRVQTSTCHHRSCLTASSPI